MSLTEDPNVRESTEDDIPHLQAILDTLELFPSEMLPEMMSVGLRQTKEREAKQDEAKEDGDEDKEYWLTLLSSCSVPIGFCYAKQEKLTNNTWNMLAIGISPKHQHSGNGTLLTRSLEKHLCTNFKARLLIVDTSSSDAFALTRKFYETKMQYKKEATIQHFWDEGDDKIIYTKKLS